MRSRKASVNDFGPSLWRKETQKRNGLKRGPTLLNEVQFLFDDAQLQEPLQTKELVATKIDPMTDKLEANLPEGEFYDSFTEETNTDEQIPHGVHETN